MKLSDFVALSFDCYGTLIDWESGIHTALASLLSRANTGLSRDAVLETFAVSNPASKP
jgi:2-haloacid dehalogenase